MTNLEEYPLHRSTFFSDTNLMDELIQNGADVCQKDKHGNTALHIATMLGHRESIALLLHYNAPVKSKNRDGWNCLMEAVSYGDRQIITSMLRKFKTQARRNVIDNKSKIRSVLKESSDFYLEVKWEFYSWIPFLSRILPSDLCKIYKSGTRLRLDTTLIDFNELKWERGNISFIFDACAENPSDQLFIVDHNSQVFQRIRYGESEGELDEEVDLLMSSDVITCQMSSKPIRFVRTIGGWFFKQEKSCKCGEYKSECYSAEGIQVIARKRREHLTADDIKKNKSALQGLTVGKMASGEFKTVRHRKSLPPPGRTPTTWEEYIGAAPALAPPLGREQVVKETVNIFKAAVAMSTEFPLTVDYLLDILEIFASFKHLKKLRRFCEIRLPPGFPVKIEIPILPMISASVTFQNFVIQKDLSADIFKIPRAYREDECRFPVL